MQACACEILLLCDADNLELSTSWLDAPLNAGALSETSLGGACPCAGALDCGASGSTEAEEARVLGTALDICFCSRCVAGAYEDDGDARGDQCKAAPSHRTGTLHEQTRGGAAGMRVHAGFPHAYT